MKTFRFLLLLSLFAGILLSCEKDNPEKGSVLVEVEFGISHILPAGTRDYNEEPENVPICQENLEPYKAEIEIQDESGKKQIYTPQVFRVGDKLYTQTIKFEVDANKTQTEFTITRFVIKNNEPDPENPDRNVIIMATPNTGSNFAHFVSSGKTLGYTFTAKPFEKAEVAMEVLCFVREQYDDFGFDWFTIGQIQILSLCFFGDICADGMGTFQEETAYAGDSEGPGPPPGWWYYYGDVAWYFDVGYGEGEPGEPIVQTIYAGQKPTDGTATYTIANEGDQFATLTIDLADWELQDKDENIKIGWFHYDENGGVQWTQPGQLEYRENYQGSGPFTIEGIIPVADPEIIVDGNPKPYDYLIIHLDIRRGSLEDYSADQEAFEGSPYENQNNGVQYEMPAIFKMFVYKDGVHLEDISPYSNLDWLGEGAPLCIQYPNNLGVEGEEFKFELYILVPDGTGDFGYQHYYTFYAYDDGDLLDKDKEIIQISHGVVEFVIGNCLYYPSEVNLQWKTPDPNNMIPLPPP